MINKIRLGVAGRAQINMFINMNMNDMNMNDMNSYQVIFI